MDLSDAEIFGSADSSSYHQESASQHPPFVAHRAPPRRGAPSRPKMASRQKKQRKGRNNANNRERTVTTLTEDPHTHYLVPTPSEEPAGAHMPPPGKMHGGMPMGPQAYPMSGNFGFGYTPPFANMHQNTHPQQQQQPFFSPPLAHRQQMSQDKPALPPGKNDLEILQNLKKMIKDGQHPFYRAIPSPAALATLYKGPVQTQGRRSDPAAAEHRSDLNAARTGQASRFGKAAGSKDVSNLNIGGLKISRDSSGPPSAGPEPRSADLSAPASGFSSGSQDTSDAQRQGRYGYQARAGTQMNDSDPTVGDRSGRGGSGFDNARPSDAAMDIDHSVHGGKDDLSRPGSWAPRGAAGHASEDRKNFGSDRTFTPRPPHGDAPPGGGRPPPPPGDGYDRDREPPRKGVWTPQNDDRARDARLTDSRRPPLAPAPEAAAAAHQPPVQRAPADPPVSSSDQRRPVDSSRPPANGSSASSHERPTSVTNTLPPARDADHDASRPPPTTPAGSPTQAADAPPAPSRPDGDDVHSSRSSSSVRPAVPSAAPAPSAPSAAPAPLAPPPMSAGGESLASSEDSSARPSLKERMEQPLASRPPRRSFVDPAATGDAHPQDRFKKRGAHGGGFQKNHQGGGGGGVSGGGGAYTGPPRGDRAYTRPPPPPTSSSTHSGDAPPPPLSSSSAGAGGPPRPFRARSPSMDARSGIGIGKMPMPPSPGSRVLREYRGPPGRERDMSRERGGGGGYGRPDYNDADGPPPGRYEGGRAYSDFSPAPGERERGRPPAAYPPSPPGPPGGRDGPPGRAEYYAPYPPERHEWDGGDDAYYKSRAWDRAGGPPPHSASERERYEREYPPRGAPAPGWDARSEREYGARDGYAPGPPHDDRYAPLPPLPPSRDADRGRPPPPPTSSSSAYTPAPAPYNNTRIRPRSPSPVGRPGAPPAKRPREDFGDYYAGGRPPPRRAPGEYPPPGAGANPDWPPASGGGPPRDRDRDYRMRDPMDYPPPPGSYERSRSPGRSAYGGRGGYARGGDRGGYAMRPPPQ